MLQADIHSLIASNTVLVSILSTENSNQLNFTKLCLKLKIKLLPHNAA